MLKRLLLVAALGAIGTLARYGLSSLVLKFRGPGFPWGTLAVNGVGCFLFGLVWSLAESRQTLTSETRLILLIGFMGAFTTFSTFAFETAEMMRKTQYLAAGGNIAAQVAGGIALLFLGFAVGKVA